ncbi:MAG: hypothetical protein ABWY25_00935 [Paenisporosarcina sp.]
MRHYIRWSFAISLVFLFSFMTYSEAYAASQLDVKATAGFQNKVKHGQGLPLTLTITNKGDEFSGDLVIDYSESYAVGSAKAYPITIGAGETKTINLSLPGLSDEFVYSGTSTQMFYFYEGDWENGKEVSYKGNKSVRPNFYGPESNFVLTLSESADRLRPFSSMKLNTMGDQQTIHLAQIKEFEFPTAASSYGIANFIIIDEYVLADLPEDAQQAIIDWIQTGGVVMIGASDNVAAEAGLLSTHLPLTLSKERKEISKEVLSSFINNKEFKNSISSFVASKNEGARILLQSDNNPLAAVMTVGKGAVIQTSFSLGDEPLSKESNATAFLANIIKKANVGLTTNSGMYMNHQGIKEQMTYEIGSINELFPSFQISTTLMLVIVIIYILLVGPLLYVLLKRKDKREYAWWIIPAVSIIASVSIFAYGAKDRLVRPQIQQVSFYEVQKDKSLTGYYVESLLSNRSGNFTFESELGTTMVGSKRMNGLSGPTTSVQGMSILEEKANKTQLTVRDVGYWSVSSVLGESTIKDGGKFDIDLTVEKGIVRGTVKNEFPFALKDVSIWSGSKMIKLGNLDPNESIEVNESIGSAVLSPISASTSYMGNTAIMQASDLPKERKSSLIRMSQNSGNIATEPAIVAHTEDPIVPIKIAGERAEISAINMVYQRFSPETIFSGEFTLPATSFEIHVSTEDPSAYFEQMGNSKFEWYMANGTYLYDWKLPSNMPLTKVNWTELLLANTNSGIMQIEIFNWNTKSFEEVKGSRFSIKEKVSDYVSTEGMVQFKIDKQGMNGDDYTRLPELRLKGEVQE